ncbi:HxlR family transcriptional regulator [Leisingera sp. ANG-M1]|uniref:winged helix-turn-helix transcriptional regulator n=1 Tax=Leisingera sp. ANG-M1 TaxID=1577895 RepID=UPI00057CE8CD|nr:helix-turn-helix domain-containing protein [Leisingera sp. ANG-M1]KIC08531.1 HxlR family transcriptional regulator [Leisingera sp. ANG-M1]
MEIIPEGTPDAFVAACPSREILARLAEKWTFLIVIALQHGPMRFGALRRKVEGVSQKMLTQTLRNLEKDGLVTRQIYDEMPLRVEYELTALGRELVPLNQAIKDWAERNMRQILEVRSSGA